MKLREPLGVSSAATGQNHAYARVTQINSDTKLASVIDQFGNKYQISTTRIFGKNSEGPLVGETWIISRMFGDWIFAVHIRIQDDV